jgi:Peptidase family S41
MILAVISLINPLLMKKILLFSLLIISQLAIAQQDCDCSKNFEATFQKIRENYAGWADKITAKNQAEFDKITAETQQKIKAIKDEKECFFALQKWFDFFKDNHLFISPINPYSIDEPAEAIDKRASKVPQFSYNEVSLMQFLKENEAKLQSVEGIWESDDKAYRVGILKDKTNPNKFTGFLLTDKDARWKTGKVKFELNQVSPLRYASNYYYADFSSEKCFSREVKNFLVIENIYKFNKVFPMPKEEVNVEDINQRLADFRIEKLDNETTLIVLPPFTMLNAVELIQEMLTKNNDLLANIPNLIIDLRNNPGGDDFAYTPLFQYIATAPIIRKGAVFRATDENIIGVRHELETIQEFPVYKERLSPKLQGVLRKMEANRGSFVNAPDKEFSFGVYMQNPKKVAFLVNKNTASTAESFILEAKQSPKTLVFGENTKGVADYIEVRDWGLPCFGWRIAYPMAKSPRLPQNSIDNVGISPDIKIPDSEADWVGFVQKYLKNKVN